PAAVGGAWTTTVASASPPPVPASAKSGSPPRFREGFFIWCEFLRRSQHDDVAGVAGLPHGVIQPDRKQTQPPRYTLPLIRHHRAHELGRTLELDPRTRGQARSPETAHRQRS